MTQNEAPGVAYSALLPLVWQPADSLAPAQLSAWQQSNIDLLRALATIETVAGDREKELGAAGKAYERLEAKLDVVLDMLSLLLAERRELPPQQQLILRASGLEWYTEQAPAASDAGLLTLYLSPKLPQPLILSARIVACTPAGTGQRVQAEFTHLSEELSDWLERTVFRYHRRAVQQAHQTT